MSKRSNTTKCPTKLRNTGPLDDSAVPEVLFLTKINAEELRDLAKLRKKFAAARLPIEFEAKKMLCKKVRCKATGGIYTADTLWPDPLHVLKLRRVKAGCEKGNTTFLNVIGNPSEFELVKQRK